MKIEPGNFSLTPDVHKVLVNNLLKRTKQLTPESITAGKDWYTSGQADSDYLGRQFGRDTLGGAAVLGKLSASTDWNRNRMMGLQTIGITGHQSRLIKRASEIGGEMRAEGKTSDEIKAQTKMLRSRAGLPGTPLDLQSSENIHAALNVAHGNVEHPLDIFSNKANSSRKTLDFTQQLATGGQHHGVVIDTHAYDAALDNYHVTYGIGNAHLAKAGVYNFMQNVYADAHRHAVKKGLVPENTSLADFQAMHWVHHINNKINVNTNAARTAKTSITQTANLLERNPQFDPLSHGLAAMNLRAPSRTPHLTAFNEGAQK